MQPRMEPFDGYDLGPALPWRVLRRDRLETWPTYRRGWNYYLQRLLDFPIS